MAFKFENLSVWHKALDLTFEVNEIAKKFPKEELFILASQIKRAADSVALNIAEGSTGQTNPEFKRFLSIALRSNIEIVACLFIARKRMILSDFDFENIYNRCEEILKMLVALRNKL